MPSLRVTVQKTFLVHLWSIRGTTMYNLNCIGDFHRILVRISMISTILMQPQYLDS
jgi:hypothetical protein